MNSAEAYLQMWERAEANTSSAYVNLPIAVEVAAKQANIEITNAAFSKIWKATDRVAHKPYTQAFYVNTEKAVTASGDCQILQDGDHICVYARGKEAKAENRFYITLKQPNTWWKSITAHTPHNTFVREIVAVQDNRHEHKALVSYADMFNYFIVLSKAKTLGIHTNMYWILNSYDLKPNHDWVIEWKKD